VIELSRYVFEELRKDEDFILYRGRSKGDASQVLVLSPAVEYPTPESLKRSEHEYSLREELDSRWAARPSAVGRHWDRPVLVLEDPGGAPLNQLLGQALDLGSSLRLAINLATAIGQLHQRGMIHKDIKPGNVLVNSATSEVWLIGFGIASRLPRERQSPDPPEFIAGTLAYMAPEQTGRMNRSIDSRSDLYSLGVTLYEMLTGSLPFTASDPMGWVHCHIARQPVPPGKRLNNVPTAVSAIIMKLLAKTAEERYQTAAGVVSDLGKCLAEWESLGRIDPFPLGAHDVSDQLLIPERLYGRDAEREVLLDAFDRVVTSGRAELVLVSGYSGIGKSSIVHELHKVIALRRGIFISGKFDQQKRDIPYATLAQAFQGLVRQILRKSEEEVGHWRDAIREAVGTNGQLMVNLIPELELIIGKQPPVPDLPLAAAQNRFQMVFVRLLGVFARAEHPLALFLDDLQWLDTGTLELLERLVTEPEVRHLLLVGAYRDNEVSPSHPLMRTLDAIRKTEVIMHEILLKPLSFADVTQIIGDALRCQSAHVHPLAELVQEKTAGNPFFAIQFLTSLSEEHLLEFDAHGSTWNWDVNRIRAKGFTDNVVDLMVGKLKRLPARTQKALRQLACLGNSAEVTTLSIVQGKSERQIHSDLLEAVRGGLVLRLGASYKFLHDRVQEAAYAFIPRELRSGRHLRIGRLLIAKMTADRVTEKIFDIVNQLNAGLALIADPDEKERVAELNLKAGRRPKRRQHTRRHALISLQAWT
jgi:serine/threonine protein kinase